jgi:NAD(P)H-flavin reductase
MPTISFLDRAFHVEPGETVLDCLTRNGAAVPSSCRSGVCQSCMMHADGGAPSPKSQNGLKESLRARGYFLSCQCMPEQDLAVSLPGEEAVARTRATVADRRLLNPDILRLDLVCEKPLGHRAGQFVHLHGPGGLTRSYSVASLPDTGVVELHVRRLPGGAMSGWLHEDVDVGATLEVSGPLGECFYLPDDPEKDILLVGTGSGLAPLLGIVRDALCQEHRGRIVLYHGGWNPAGLYLVDELREMDRLHENFTYVPCVDEGASEAFTGGRAHEVALRAHPSLKGWRVYLCGHPEMVAFTKKRAFLAGASMREIHADPFVVSAPPKQSAAREPVAAG